MVDKQEFFYIYGFLVKLYVRWYMNANEGQRIIPLSVGKFVWEEYMPPSLRDKYPQYAEDVVETTKKYLNKMLGEYHEKNGFIYWRY